MITNNNAAELSKLQAEYMSQNPQENLIFSNKDNLGLGINRNTDSINNNIMVIGDLHGGKNEKTIMDIINQQKTSFVIRDTVGFWYSHTYKSLRDNGYDIKCIDLNTPSHSNRYNPLGQDYDVSDIDTLSLAISSNAEDITSLNATCLNYLVKSVLSYIVGYEKKPSHCNLTYAYKLFEQSLEPMEGMWSKIDLLFKNMDRTKDDLDSFKIYAAFLNAAGDKRFALYKIAIDILAPYLALHELTSDSDIVFEDLYKKKTAIFVITPDKDKYDYQIIENLFFANLTKFVSTVDSANVNTQIILNDFGRMKKVNGFHVFCSDAGKHHTSVVLDVVSDKDFDQYTEGDRSCIINSCHTIIYNGLKNDFINRYIVEQSGTIAVIVKKGLLKKEERQIRPFIESDLAKLDNKKSIVLIKTFEPFIIDTPDIKID